MIPGDIVASHVFHKWGGYNLINPDKVKRKCINAKLFPIFFTMSDHRRANNISQKGDRNQEKKIKAKNQKNPPEPFKCRVLLLCFC